MLLAVGHVVMLVSFRCAINITCKCGKFKLMRVVVTFPMRCVLMTHTRISYYIARVGLGFCLFVLIVWKLITGSDERLSYAKLGHKKNTRTHEWIMDFFAQPNLCSIFVTAKQRSKMFLNQQFCKNLPKTMKNQVFARCAFGCLTTGRSEPCICMQMGEHGSILPCLLQLPSPWARRRKKHPFACAKTQQLYICVRKRVLCVTINGNEG